MRLTDPEEITAAKSRLKQAEDTLHRIMMGEQVASYRDQNGEQVAYSKPPTRESLESYILMLKSQLGMIDQSCGPLRVYFP